MKQPRWKTWWSYVAEIALEEVRSQYSGLLRLTYSKGRYLLSSPNAVYSYQDLYTNFRTAFRQLQPQKLGIQRVLVLGLGLGSIPHLLEKQHQQHYHYTCVELDPQVIYLAQKYTLPDLTSDITIVESDAYIFIKKCIQQFDLITIDIFIDDQVPAVFEQLDFLEAIRSCLTPQGWVLFNRMTNSPTRLQHTKTYYQSIFQRVFPDASCLDLDGNQLLLNHPIV